MACNVRCIESEKTGMGENARSHQDQTLLGAGTSMSKPSRTRERMSEGISIKPCSVQGHPCLNHHRHVFAFILPATGISQSLSRTMVLNQRAVTLLGVPWHGGRCIQGNMPRADQGADWEMAVARAHTPATALSSLTPHAPPRSRGALGR